MLSRRNRSRLKRNRRWVRVKNQIKIIRTFIQYFILIIVGYSIANAVISFASYVTPDKSKWTNYEDFVAISYFGIARNTSGSHISQKELNAQLHVLKQLGYETISQQDIYEFYTNKKPLPEKALYLAFEDGRNDSALFSNKILEQLNYKATMLSYANKLEQNEGKFLSPKMMLEMKENGYWELGTNGFRLAYINVEDDSGGYYESLTQEQFSQIDTPIRYNHYLMDFIRDENNIPIENSEEMRRRLNADYENMGLAYSKSVGYVPETYMLMHADSLYYSMNPLVEEVNDERIRNMFSLHFNREGFMSNSIHMDRYDLTRVQPAPYWRTNHLLMKLELDTGKAVHFVTGDLEQADKWIVRDGVAQFTDEEIVLTTRPNMQASMNIKHLKLDGSFTLEVTLAGHTSGEQFIVLGYSSDQTLQLRLRLKENMVYLEQVDEKGKVERKLAVKGKVKEMNEVPLKITVDKQNISLDIRHHNVMKVEPIDHQITDWNITFAAKSLMNENRWEDEGNYIYDGIFKGVQIIVFDEDNKRNKVVFSNKLSGVKKTVYIVKQFIDKAIDWGIETF